MYQIKVAKANISFWAEGWEENKECAFLTLLLLDDIGTECLRLNHYLFGAFLFSAVQQL